MALKNAFPFFFFGNENPISFLDEIQNPHIEDQCASTKPTT
jgi:hypothetical protein